MSEKVAARVKVSEPKRTNQPARQTPAAPVRLPVASPVNRIQTLQRTAGNQAVLGMIRSGAIQLKPGGPLFSGGPSAPAGFGTLLNSPGPGAELPSHIQHNLETSLGVPMDPVRVHTDKRANVAADGIGARAFTYGTNIFLGSRERPTDLGLMAHEAAHVVQQTGAPIVQRKAGSDSSEALEREADRVAAAAQRGESTPVEGRTGVVRPQFWSIRGAIGAVGRGISSAASAVADVAGNIIERAVKFIKERARSIPGYDLLGFILGRDPLTQQPMERTATNLLKGLLGLIPGGAAMFENLQKAGVIERAFSWVTGELEKLNITWSFIRGAIDRFLSTLGAADLLNLGGVFERARAIFGPIVSRIGSFAVAVGKKILEFIFEGAMALAGGAGQRIINIFRRIGATFSLILSDPIKFLSNLIGAVKGGFQRFANNILEHLKAALFEWLFGALAGAGLTLPQKWDLKGIMSLVLQVLGLTYARLRGKLVRLIGEPAVAFIEKAFEFLRIVVTQGLAAAWEKIVEFATGLVDTVLDGIKNWVVTSIVKSAVTKIATMFNPVGAIINAIITIYNTIMFVIERAKQLAAFVESVIDSITNIAEGKISAAVAYVEGTLARILPLAISFLARLLGLGGISETIRNIIKRIQDPVDKALDKIVDWIRDKAKGLVGKSAVPDKGVKLSHKDIIKTVKQKLTVPAKATEAAAAIQEKKKEVDELKRMYQPMLEPGIKLTIQTDENVQGVTQDSDIDFTIRIAPNTEEDKAQSVVKNLPTGTKDDPITIKWTKRWLEGYRPIWLAPREETGAPLSQAEVQKKKNAKEFMPNKSDQDVFGHGKIGVDDYYQTKLNRVVGPKSASVRGSGVPDFKALLYSHGFSRTDNADGTTDMDHVVELQIGGQDIIKNLWPLNSTENQASGRNLHKMEIRYLDKDGKPAKKKFGDLDNGKFWFKLSER